MITPRATTATLRRIQQETNAVKSFRFDLTDPDFSFLPGQWVDFYIDTAATMLVGGYSITSTPLEHGALELAVKLGGRPATYLHNQAQVDDTFVIDGGYGNFYYREVMGAPLLLIAGGIGITPLISIVRYVEKAGLDVPITLLYSAPSPSELAFHNELTTRAYENPRMLRYLPTVTRTDPQEWSGRHGRINQALVQQHLPPGEPLVYLCGPPSMMDQLSGETEDLGVPASRIKAERWW